MAKLERFASASCASLRLVSSSLGTTDLKAKKSCKGLIKYICFAHLLAHFWSRVLITW